MGTSCEAQKQLIFVYLEVAEKCMFQQLKMAYLFLVLITSCGDSTQGFEAVKFVDSHRKYPTKETFSLTRL